MNKLFGSIETGGTKIKVALFELLDYKNSKISVVSMKEILTTTPSESMKEVCGFFIDSIKKIEAIGIGSFGPIDIKNGVILKTPKVEWQNFNILNYLKKSLSFDKFIITTDTNAAAYGEYKIGASKNTNSSVYTTVGTGIGSGIIVNGKLLPINDTSETGHIYVQKHILDKNFDGVCPIHKGCLEGLASGPSYKARTGLEGYELEETDSTHNIVAYYLAQLCLNFLLFFKAEKLVFGGGVSKDIFFIPKIKDELKKLLNNYISVDIDKCIVSAKLGQNAGIYGSALLAIDKYYFNPN